MTQVSLQEPGRHLRIVINFQNAHSFGMSLLDLAKQAYPYASKELVTEYARNQFFKGLHDDEVRKRLIFSDIKDFNELLDQATSITAILNSYPNCQTTSVPSSQPQHAFSYHNNQRPNFQQNNQQRPFCDYCNRVGHTRQICKNLAAAQNNQISHSGSQPRYYNRKISRDHTKQYLHNNMNDKANRRWRTSL